MSRREPHTPRQSDTLQRAPDFKKMAMRVADRASKLVDIYDRQGLKHSAITCRAIRDEASLLALEFQSWGARQTTSAERQEFARRLLKLQERVALHDAIKD